MDVMHSSWGKNGKWAAPRVQSGRVKAELGRKTKVCIQVALEKAMCATMRCTSSGCVGLVKVVLSCHMALDMLCQEMHEAWLSGVANERRVVTA